MASTSGHNIHHLFRYYIEPNRYFISTNLQNCLLRRLDLMREKVDNRSAAAQKLCKWNYGKRVVETPKLQTGKASSVDRPHLRWDRVARAIRIDQHTANRCRDQMDHFKMIAVQQLPWLSMKMESRISYRWSTLRTYTLEQRIPPKKF